MAPQMRRAFRDAISLSTARIQPAPIAELWSKGPEAVFHALPWRDMELDWLGGFADALLATLQASAKAHARVFRGETIAKQEPVGRLELSLDLTNPRAVRWAQTRAAELVTQVSEETKATIRRLIADMYFQGIPPDKAARMLRQHIGLTERDSRAVANLQTRLAREQAARVAEGREPLPDERLVGQVDRYSERLLRNRATLIVRTESIRASAQGQQELWNQAQDQGLLDKEFTRRIWIVTPDERLCEICAPMADDPENIVGLDEPFTDGEGQSVMNPPVHPQCRCAVGLVFADEAGEFRYAGR